MLKGDGIWGGGQMDEEKDLGQYKMNNKAFSSSFNLFSCIVVLYRCSVELKLRYVCSMHCLIEGLYILCVWIVYIWKIYSILIEICSVCSHLQQQLNHVHCIQHEFRFPSSQEYLLRYFPFRHFKVQFRIQFY